MRYQDTGHRHRPALLPGIVILGVLALSGILVAVDQPLWGLALVLFGLAAVFTAAARCGWRWDRDRGDDRGSERRHEVSNEAEDEGRGEPPPVA
jgi:hypothetical protein